MILSYTTPEGWFISHEVEGFSDNFEDYKKAFDLLLAPTNKTFNQLHPDSEEIVFKIGGHNNTKPYKSTVRNL